MSKHSMTYSWFLIIASALMTLILSFSTSEAALPSLTTTELADFVESYQKCINRAQFKYTLTYGSLKKGDISKGIFIAKSPAWSVDAESAVDFTKGIEYIHEDQLSKGKHYVEESAFDGKIGTQLSSSEPGSDEWIGKIVKGPPRMLRSEGRTRWRPEEVAYWPIPGYDMANIIRKATKIRIESDEIDGRLCYKVTFLFRTEKVIEHEGKKMTANLGSIYRVWLAPDLNMLPVRFERLRPDRDNPDDMIGEPAVIRQQSDFRELSPGVWFPFRCSHIRTWTNREPQAIIINVNEIALNEDASVPARVQFPKGTRMTDEITRLKYTVGLTEERFLDSAALVAENIKAVQEERLQPRKLGKTNNIDEKPNNTLTSKIMQDKTAQVQDVGEKDIRVEEEPMSNEKTSFLLFGFIAGASILLIVLLIFILKYKQIWIRA